MSRSVRQISNRNLEEEALDYALSKLLSNESKQDVLVYFRVRHAMSLEGIAPLTTKEIKNVLDTFLGTGSNLILNEFYNRLAELRTQK